MVSKIRTSGHMEQQFLSHCFLTKFREILILVIALKFLEIVLHCCKPFFGHAVDKQAQINQHSSSLQVCVHFKEAKTNANF